EQHRRREQHGEQGGERGHLEAIVRPRGRVEDMVRPVIGIPSPIERARWGAWEEPAHVLNRSYVDAVHRAGGAAIILPADPVWVTDPDDVLDRIDGLLLAGGADIDPQRY